MTPQIPLREVDVAYATASAGMHAKHTLPLKLEAIAEAGFKWTEIAFPDLEQYASSKFSAYAKLDNTGLGDTVKLMEAATEIHDLCRRLGLQVLTVMPCALYFFPSNMCPDAYVQILRVRRLC